MGGPRQEADAKANIEYTGRSCLAAAGTVVIAVLSNQASFSSTTLMVSSFPAQSSWKCQCCCVTKILIYESVPLGLHSQGSMQDPTACQSPRSTCRRSPLSEEPLAARHRAIIIITLAQQPQSSVSTSRRIERHAWQSPDPFVFNPETKFLPISD